MKPFAITGLLLLLSLPCSAHSGEREESARLALEYGGRAEVVMDDGTRCDIITAFYAIEVEWANKWAEAIGQSLHYASRSNKQPAIILITHNPRKDWRHIMRCSYLCGKLSIKLYIEPLTSPSPPEPPHD